MQTGRPIPVLRLSEAERETLQNWARRPKSAQALALRARIVLRCAEGVTNTEVARQMGVRKATAGKWRQRFVDRRLDGLLDEPRPGAPRKITDADVERALAMTLESTPKDATHWSTRSLAKEAGLSRTTVGRIWRAFSLQPHRSETFKLSKDPLFIEKVRDIVGLYLNPPDRALVLCVDEKSHDTIEQAVPSGLDVHLIVDNYGTHKTVLIRRWLAKRPRFHVHFTPTSASWINLVERWFAALTEKQIRRGVHRSVRELESAIKQYLAATNESPKPFIWTKTADEILASVARFCAWTSGSGH